MMVISQGPSWFHIGFIVVAVAIAAVFVFVIVSIVRNASRARQSGLNPLTLQTDLVAKVMNSEMLAPERPIAERLAELDTLFAAGTISEAEHAAARARILGGA
jgi:hypothetical protein